MDVQPATPAPVAEPPKQTKPKSGKGLLSRLWRLSPWVFGFAVIALLFVGYRLRHLDLFTAEHGAGYAFGIIGASMMLALLLYPLRKRTRLRAMGSPRFWFRLHMAFGVLGPAFILLHANFHLGSTNSNVALWSMLIVAGSGLAGRYIYTRIHHGLYGRKATLAELTARLGQERDELATLFSTVPNARQALTDMADRVIAREEKRVGALRQYLQTAFETRGLAWRLPRLIRNDIRQNAALQRLSSKERKALARRARMQCRHVLQEAAQLSAFTVYDRLFSLWHILHLPLVFMLVITAIVHVVAVHLY